MSYAGDPEWVIKVRYNNLPSFEQIQPAIIKHTESVFFRIKEYPETGITSVEWTYDLNGEWYHVMGFETDTVYDIKVELKH
jgi:hypothetical protein